MKRSSIYVCLALCTVLLVVAGVVHGRITNRWGPPADLLAAGRHLESLPEALGDWELRESHEIDEQVREILECTGSLHRVYVNPNTGDVARLALIVGPPGPMVIHTPEICYTSQSYDLVEGPYPMDMKSPAGAAQEFRGMRFRSPDVTATELSVCFAFTDDGRWRAPKYPRAVFGGSPLVYKLQLAVMKASYEQGEEDLRVAFLQELLPRLKEHLFENRAPGD